MRDPAPPHWVRPYGDTLDDGRVQLSLTLPLACDDRAKEAARQCAAKMGLDDVTVVHAEPMGPDFSLFVLYATFPHAIDVNAITVEAPDYAELDKHAIDALIFDMMGRKMVVIGACIETDAHTVGIDAIMNMKGFNGHKGLESYHNVRAINLGAQVEVDVLVARAVAERADVILVSQVVTQKDIHIANLKKLRAALDASGLGREVIVVAGGPRIGHELARELGFDAGFGPGSYAEHVASYAIHEWMRRHARQDGAAAAAGPGTGEQAA